MTVLVDIGGGHRLAPAPAESWRRAVAAGCPETITSSYRDPVEQQRLRTLYLAGQYPAYVAPIEKSEHVVGNALDLKDPAIAWMRAHPEYGWSFTDPTERWHVAYRLLLDRSLLITPTLTPPALRATNPLKEDPVLIYSGGGIYLLNGGVVLPIGDPKTADALAAKGVPSIEISLADLKLWQARTAPGMLLVRGPGTRGVALLGGKDGWSSMTSEADVAALQAAGVPLSKVTEDQFLAFMQ